MPNIDKIYSVLKKEFERFHLPVVDEVEAKFKDPFMILITTILSARTKDTTTSQVIKTLFDVIKRPEDIEKYTVEEIEELIYPVGFYHSKARYLKKLPEVLIREFDGIIPDEIDEMLKLPGVGRKTANLVRAIAFKKPAICVDVHVHRISNRWGLVSTNTPYETEMALRKILPEKYWIYFNSYVVAFGQNLCTPRNPDCSKCPIYAECARINVNTKFKRAD